MLYEALNDKSKKKNMKIRGMICICMGLLTQLSPEKGLLSPGT